MVYLADTNRLHNNNRILDNMTNILLDCNIFSLQKFGGISKYWNYIYSYMSEAHGANCFAHRSKNILFQDFCENKCTQIFDPLPPSLSRYLPIIVNNSSYLVHSPYYRIPIGRYHRYFTTVHDFTYERYRAGPAKWVHSAQKINSIRRADAIFCVSLSTKNDLLEIVDGIDETRIFVTPLGVDPLEFYPDPDIHLNNSSRYILFVGQRSSYKRFDIMLDIIASIQDMDLRIVGPELSITEIAELNRVASGRWIYEGAVSNMRLRKLYSSAFVFIFPSDYEGFGLPILEAMSCGCPVIASNRSSFPEVSNGAALLAQAQNAGEYIDHIQKLDSDNFRQEICARGFARARQLTWKNTCDLTDKFYMAAS